MVGDPSGKSDMRKVMTKETIEHNAECFRRQLGPVIVVDPGRNRNASDADRNPLRHIARMGNLKLLNIPADFFHGARLY